MRGYTVATAAVTLGVPPKWVDNVLSHHRVPGVAPGRQGVARKLTVEAILALELTLRLSHALGAPLPRSLEIATELLRSGTTALPVGERLSLVIDLPAIHDEITRRLAQAVEIAPVPRRGRPKGSGAK